MEKAIGADVERKAGEAPSSVTCPRDLPARSDASISCVIVTHGVRFETKVSVTSVDEAGGVRYDYSPGRVLPGSQTAMSSDVLQSKISADYVDRTGNGLKSLQCLPLAVRTGAMTHCVLLSDVDGKRHLVTVTATSARGDDVAFDYEVEDEALS